jgi:hypothetical protein
MDRWGEFTVAADKSSAFLLNNCGRPDTVTVRRLLRWLLGSHVSPYTDE